jgi:predicted dehydrogenase
MPRQTVGIIVNGVTGRMGYRQHLVRSLLAIREQGGIELADGTVLWPEPVLVGRNPERLRAIAERHGLERWTTSLDTALADPDLTVYFDAQVTGAREAAVTAAIAAGKHVYTEKPVADSLDGALRLVRAACDAKLVHGVVADKLFLPGLRKLRRLVEGGFFGRILSVRIDFGYWVFEGDWQPAQRPSWNYRAQDGGGIVLDMFPHWRYVLEHLIAPVESVYAHATTHIPRRFDERGEPYEATADDAAYAILELSGGVVAQICCSWTVRVNRPELVEIQVDGVLGSAVAGLRGCKVQDRAMTPRPVWNPDVAEREPYREQWAEVPDNVEFDNGFKAEWEMFLTHAHRGEPFPYDLLDGAKGVQLAYLALDSAREGRRVAVPTLEVP